MAVAGALSVVLLQMKGTCATILPVFLQTWKLERWPTRWMPESCVDAIDFEQDIGGCTATHWGPLLSSPSVLGTPGSMRHWCAQLPPSPQRNSSVVLGNHACILKGYNMLRSTPWTLCKNMRWLACVARGQACAQHRNCSREFVVTFPPSALVLSRPIPALLTESDMYTLEVCAMEQFCDNAAELWTVSADTFAPFSFTCRYNHTKWRRFLVRTGAASPRGARSKHSFVDTLKRRLRCFLQPHKCEIGN